MFQLANARRPTPGSVATLCLLALGVLAAVLPPARAQEPLGAAPPEPRATSEPSTALVDLNRAIKAYLDEDRDTAAAAFQHLLDTQPTATLRVPCHYYLGLIGLERGLKHSTAAQAARTEKNEATAQQEAAAAREQFEQAQAQFEEVVRLADPTVEVVNAALLLGISRLASDFPGSQLSAHELALRAEDTLKRYVATDYGAQDRYGQFYLAVAHYRLADEYRKDATKGPEFADAFQSARAALEHARVLAEADVAGQRLTPAGQDEFVNVLTYYDGLLAILWGDNAAARQDFTAVSERAAGTDLANNATAIVAKLDEAEARQPHPVQLPVPAPLGPFELDTRLTMGHAYNSNVILLGRDTILPRGYRRSDDYQFGLGADFNLSRRITRREAPWVGESLTLGLGGGTDNVWQPNIPQFDINRYLGRAYVNWEPIRDLYLGFQYEYSYTQLGHAPFISSNRVTPVLSKVWRRPGAEGAELEFGRTDVYFSQDDRTYFDRLVDRRTNRDGVYRALGIRQSINLVQAQDLPLLKEYYSTREAERKLFGERWLAIYLGYEFRDEQTVGTEFDMRGHSLLWGLTVPLPLRLAFELNSEFTWGNYSSPSIFDYERKRRSDFLQRYDMGFVYTIVARGENPTLRTLNVRLRTGVEMSFQNSNIWDRLGEDIYEYNRTVYGMRLEVDF
jgi:hypothetical protein